MFEALDIDITSNKKYEPLIDIVAAPIVPNSNFTFKVAKQVPAFFNKKPNVLIPEDAHLVSYVGKGLKDMTEEAAFRAANTEKSIHNNPFLKDLPGFNGPMARLGRVLEENEKGTLYAKNIIEDELAKGKQKVAGVFFKPKKYDSATEAFLEGLEAAKNRAATDVDAVVPNARQAFKNLPGSQKKVAKAIKQEEAAKALAVDSPKEFRNMSDVKKALKSLGINATKTKTITYDTLSKFSESIHALPATESDAVIGLAGLSNRNNEYLINKAKNELQLAIDDAAITVEDMITSIRRRSKDMAGDIKPALYNNPNATVNLASDGYDFYGVIKTESGNPAVIRISGDAKIDSGFGARGITFNRYTPITENTKLNRVDTVMFNKAGKPFAMPKNILQDIDSLKDAIKHPLLLKEFMKDSKNKAFIKARVGKDLYAKIEKLSQHPATTKIKHIGDISTPMVDLPVEMQSYLSQAESIIQNINKNAQNLAQNYRELSNTSRGNILLKQSFNNRFSKAFNRPEVTGNFREIYDGLEIETKGAINDFLNSPMMPEDKAFLAKMLEKEPAFRHTINAKTKISEFINRLIEEDTQPFSNAMKNQKDLKDAWNKLLSPDRDIKHVTHKQVRELREQLKAADRESRKQRTLLQKEMNIGEEGRQHLLGDSEIQNSSLTYFRSALGGDDAVGEVLKNTRADIYMDLAEREAARLAKEITKKAPKLDQEYIRDFVLNSIKSPQLLKLLSSGKAEIWKLQDVQFYHNVFSKYVGKNTTLVKIGEQLVTPQGKILPKESYNNLMKLAKDNRLKIDVADGQTIKQELMKKPSQKTIKPVLRKRLKNLDGYGRDVVEIDYTRKPKQLPVAIKTEPKGQENMGNIMVPMIKPMPKMENPYTKDLVKQVLATVGIVATAGFIFKKAYDTLKQVDQEMEREGYSPAERYQTMVEIAKSKEFDDKFRPVAQNLYNISTVKVPSVAERIMGLFRRN